MIDETVQGAHVLGLMTLGLRNIYSKKEIKKIEDIKGMKVRVQATPTEDTMFPAYGAQTVHMPFGDVYTSLQTGVVDVAENGVNVYLVNKHYEVAPVLSMTEHEANNNLHLDQRQDLGRASRPSRRAGCRRRPTRSPRSEPAKALELEKQSADQAQEAWASRSSTTSTSRASSRMATPDLRTDGQGSRAARGEDPRS